MAVVVKGLYGPGVVPARHAAFAANGRATCYGLHELGALRGMVPASPAEVAEKLERATMLLPLAGKKDAYRLSTPGQFLPGAWSVAFKDSESGGYIAAKFTEQVVCCLDDGRIWWLTRSQDRPGLSAAFFQPGGQILGRRADARLFLLTLVVLFGKDHLAALELQLKVAPSASASDRAQAETRFLELLREVEEADEVLTRALTLHGQPDSSSSDEEEEETTDGEKEFEPVLPPKRKRSL